MLKRLGITLGIPIVLFFYLYFCKYLGSLMWPDRTTGYHWFNSGLLFGVFVLPTAIAPVTVITMGLIVLGDWVILGNGAGSKHIPYDSHPETEEQKILAELNKEFPGSTEN
ncbi:MAG TPA: hypothetical protein ENH82_13125 [bacterium]|nr:hypothetical protein [bacterium]